MREWGYIVCNHTPINNHTPIPDRACISISLVTASLPTDLDQVRTSNSQRSTASNSDTFQLPSYDQCIPDDEGYGMPGEEEEEVMMDENERIALQEAEDERLAREMMQREDDEVRKI